MALTTTEKPVYPEDIQFGQATERLYPAITSMTGRPLDFSRRGGAAIEGAEEMYRSLHGAASRAAGQRRMQSGMRDLQHAQARRMKSALTDKLRAEAAKNLISGGYGMVMDEFAKQRLGGEPGPAEVDGQSGIGTRPDDPRRLRALPNLAGLGVALSPTFQAHQRSQQEAQQQLDWLSRMWGR